MIIDFVNDIVKRNKIEGLKNAKNTAIHKRDQRILEESLGGSSGSTPVDKYPGMSIIDVEQKETKD